jgi:hypothetical protein
MSGRLNAWVVTDPRTRFLARKYSISEYLLSAINVQDPKAIEQIALANKLNPVLLRLEAPAPVVLCIGCVG